MDLSEVFWAEENSLDHHCIKLINKLKECEIIKTGEFILKSGETSNIYFDFRNLISYPRLLNEIVGLLIVLLSFFLLLSLLTYYPEDQYFSSQEKIYFFWKIFF